MVKLSLNLVRCAFCGSGPVQWGIRVNLGEPSAFLGIKVDVVSPYFAGWCGGVGCNLHSRCSPSDLEFYFVVLKGDEWEVATWVAAKPKLEWDNWIGLCTGSGRKFLLFESTSHVFVSWCLRFWVLSSVPKLHPFVSLLVNFLTTDFKSDFTDEFRTINTCGSLVASCRHFRVNHRFLNGDCAVCCISTYSAWTTDGLRMHSIEKLVCLR